MDVSSQQERRYWWRLSFFLQHISRSSSHATGRGLWAHPYMRIAVIAVAISLAAMEVSISVSRGFQQEITQRVVGFLGHLQLVSLDRNTSYEQAPVDTIANLALELRDLAPITRVSPFAQKPGIVKTADNMQGCVLKGYADTEDLAYFRNHLLWGRLPRLKPEQREVDDLSEVLLSHFFCRSLGLDTGQRMTVYFVEQPPRVRQFRIVGVYETQFENFDKTYLFTDLPALQSLNGWNESQVGGYEIRLRSLNELDAVRNEVEERELGRIQRDGSMLRVVDVRESHAALFDWLALQDINVIVLFILMLLVAGVNMISVLLILVLDRTHMIGLLKAFGAQARQLSLLFLLYAARILAYGLLLGNLVGLSLCYSEWRWHWISLSPAEYYVDYVPVEFDLCVFLAVNGITILVTLLLLLGTTQVIGRIAPSEVLSRQTGRPSH